MKRPLVWVTGASGLLGSAVAKTAPDRDAVICLHRNNPVPKEMAATFLDAVSTDLADINCVQEVANSYPPAAVIHCAALTQGNLCEADPKAAVACNVTATSHLVDVCRELNVPMVHCSTDLVFDGSEGPYSEEDQRSPVGVYAETKAHAEGLVRGYENALVVRLPIMLGPSPRGGRSTDEWICSALTEGRPITLFVDEFRTPIHTHLAAEIIWDLLAAGECGLLHLAGSTRISRWDLGHALAGHFELPTTSMTPGSVADFKGTPPRCPDVSLRTDRLEAKLGRPAPSLDESLALLGRE